MKSTATSPATNQRRTRSRSKSKTRISLAGTNLKIDTEKENKIRNFENYFNENWLLRFNSHNLKLLLIKLEKHERYKVQMIEIKGYFSFFRYLCTSTGIKWQHMLLSSFVNFKISSAEGKIKVVSQLENLHSIMKKSKGAGNGFQIILLRKETVHPYDFKQIVDI